ncbi:MAG: hypothetical protein OFPI_29100 [Osedax symbiont Rs2]|nr:MAG: hypothetical protein OFPI_29100 [Osedax symbiont Rs2]
MFKPMLLCSFFLASTVLAGGSQTTTVCSYSNCKQVQLSLTFEPKAQGFSTSQVWQIVEDILQVSGLAPNFEVVASKDVGNAAALIRQQQRFLAYNKDWMNSLKGDAMTRWRVYAVMAHEIGHHLQGHTIERGGSHPKIELEADNYAGFILAGLGGSLKEALVLWQGLSKSGSSTHPARDQRLQAVELGWNRWHQLMAKASRNNGVKKEPITTSNPADYILPASSRRLLNIRDIDGFSAAKVRLARNEIFARHGYIFNSLDLQRHFKQYGWYQASTRSAQLSVTERANVSFLLSSERQQPTPASPSDSGYIIADSAVRLLSNSELSHFNRSQLRLIRNEIFARHGYVFNSTDLNHYFKQRSWYRPKGKSVALSSIEQANVQLLKRLEK